MLRRRAGLILLWLVCLSAAGTRSVAAQPAAATPPDSTAVHQVELVDGSKLFVHVLEEDEGAVRVRLLTGDELRIERSRIRSLEPARGRLRGGRFLREDPNPTRLFFAPTGRTLPRGSGYIALYEIVMPFVAFAPTDRFVLAGGTPFVPEVIGEIFWIAPKLNVAHRGSMDAAVGVLAFAVGDEDLTGGIMFGVATFGRPDKALTLGAGYGFADGELAESPALMLGLELQASGSVKLLSESYVFEGEGVTAAGVRFFGERLSADVGIAVPYSSVETWIPLVNFAYTW